jgi:hypothetical protein
MDAEIKDVGVIVRDVLNAISVVYIPIQNEDAVSGTRVNGIFGRHSDVIEIAKSHWCICQSMMARGSDKCCAITK